MTQVYKFQIPEHISFNISFENTEICANMGPKENHLYLYANTVGPPDKRASCQHRKYTPFIFHTHPGTSYTSPSKEDIEKIYKNKIHTSVIATLWGLFQITKTDLEKEVSPTELHKFQETDLVNIKKYIDLINKTTVNPEYLKVRLLKIKPKIYKNLEWEKLSSQQHNSIYEYIGQINRILEKHNMRVIFTPYHNEKYYDIY